METSSHRISSPTRPTADQLDSWMGSTAMFYWRRLQEFIQNTYPAVFSPDWLYGGSKHGWSLRYKKGKSFCTLIPEKGRCCVAMVFGAEERKRFERIRWTISERVQAEYDAAKTYHDGKWVLVAVASDRTSRDVETLLMLKRKPKRTA